MSGSLLNKFGFKFVFEAKKFILSKFGMYVGKGYLRNRMFKLNVLATGNSKNNIVSAYLVKFSSSLEYNRLGYVNYKRMHEMIKLDLLPYCDKNKEKCNTGMLTKKSQEFHFLKLKEVSKFWT